MAGGEECRSAAGRISSLIFPAEELHERVHDLCVLVLVMRNEPAQVRQPILLVVEYSSAESHRDAPLRRVFPDLDPQVRIIDPVPDGRVAKSGPAGPTRRVESRDGITPRDGQGVRGNPGPLPARLSCRALLCRGCGAVGGEAQPGEIPMSGGIRGYGQRCAEEALAGGTDHDLGGLLAQRAQDGYSREHKRPAATSLAPQCTPTGNTSVRYSSSRGRAGIPAPWRRLRPCTGRSWSFRTSGHPGSDTPWSWS